MHLPRIFLQLIVASAVLAAVPAVAQDDGATATEAIAEPEAAADEVSPDGGDAGFDSDEGKDETTLASEPDADEVLIPNFWDPNIRTERPAVGAVPSIRFITTDDFPPFNFLDANGQLTGFNVDLARSVCKLLDIPCTIQSREWDDLIDRVGDGTADAIIAGIAISSASRARLDFSDIYLRVPARFIVKRDAEPLTLTPTGLKGRTLAVVGRTAHEAYLAALFPEVRRRIFSDADAARGAIRDGTVDAHFGDGLQLSFWLQSEAADGCCAFAGGPYLESRFFGQGHAIAVAKGNSELREAIDFALRALYDSGRYGELYLRYFPVGFF